MTVNVDEPSSSERILPCCAQALFPAHNHMVSYNPVLPTLCAQINTNPQSLEDFPRPLYRGLHHCLLAIPWPTPLPPISPPCSCCGFPSGYQSFS